MKWRMLACWLACLTFCARGSAEQRPVIVLVPKELGSDEWPEGTQAVVAELSANGFQVIRQQSSAVTAGELLAEVAHSAPAKSVLGVVAVLREGDTGAAYVWTEHGERVLRDDSSGAQGAVAEGAVALRVVELLRTETLNFPLGASAPQRPAKPQETRAQPPNPTRYFPWFGVSTVFPTRAATLPLQVSLGMTAEFASPMALDVTLRAGIVPARFETSAGRLSLSALDVGGRLMVQTSSNHTVSFAVGLGMSSLWLRDSATGSGGYSGKSDSTQVALLTMRARLMLRKDRWFGVVIVDPGLAMPAVSVRSTVGEVAQLGRPWLAGELGVGWSL